MTKNTQKKEMLNEFWLSADDNRNPPYGTVHASGTLNLGKYMHESLGETLLIKFVDDSCTLIIKNSADNVGIKKSHRISLIILARKLKSIGLALPIDFWFEYNHMLDQWEGHVIAPIRKRKERNPMSTVVISEENKLLIPAYRKMVNKILYNTAKSTPIEERCATAEMAVCLALRDYNPAFGSLNQYVEWRIRDEIIHHNKQYTKVNRFDSISLDAPIKDDEKNKFGDFLLHTSALCLKNPEDSLDRELYLEYHKGRQDK